PGRVFAQDTLEPGAVLEALRRMSRGEIDLGETELAQLARQLFAACAASEVRIDVEAGHARYGRKLTPQLIGRSESEQWLLRAARGVLPAHAYQRIVIDQYRAGRADRRRSASGGQRRKTQGHGRPAARLRRDGQGTSVVGGGLPRVREAEPIAATLAVR